MHYITTFEANASNGPKYILQLSLSPNFRSFLLHGQTLSSGAYIFRVVRPNACTINILPWWSPSLTGLVCYIVFKGGELEAKRFVKRKRKQKNVHKERDIEAKKLGNIRSFYLVYYMYYYYSTLATRLQGNSKQ